jgi:integrase
MTAPRLAERNAGIQSGAENCADAYHWLHDLRHSRATLPLAQGVSPHVVMETLGHSQVSLTLNTYNHVLPALQQDAAAKMDAMVGGR